MSRGENKKKREAAKQAEKLESQGVEKPTSEASQAPAQSSSDKIDNFVQGIQSELRGGNYDRSADMLSEMLGLEKDSAISPTELKSLVTLSNAAKIPVIGKETVTMLNETLAAKNEKHVDLKPEQFANIANIAHLDTKTFVGTLESLVPDESMKIFHNLAAEQANAPEQKQTVHAQNTSRHNDGQKKEKQDQFDLMRFLSDDAYQAEKGAEIIVAIANLEQMANRLASSNSPMAQTIGKMLGSFIGIVKPMINDFMDTSSPDSKIVKAPEEKKTAEEPSNKEDVKPVKTSALNVDEPVEGYNIALAARNGLEQFNEAAPEGYPFNDDQAPSPDLTSKPDVSSSITMSG